MAFEIRKIKNFPPAFDAADEVLATGNGLEEIPHRLEDLGFADCKTKIVEGAKVYYKGKTNMVYVKYIQKVN